MFKRREIAPRDHGLEEIAVWEAWFRSAHEQLLHDSADQHLVEQRRAEVDSLATAIVARMTSDYLSRRQL